MVSQALEFPQHLKEQKDRDLWEWEWHLRVEMAQSGQAGPLVEPLAAGLGAELQLLALSHPGQEKKLVLNPVTSECVMSCVSVFAYMCAC